MLSPTMLDDATRGRRGFTLIELLVAMIVGGVAFALVATISVRQQRVYADLGDRAALAGQLRQATAILPIELHGVSPGAGDIREARDTAIELRGTIASAVVCDTLPGALILAPSVAGAATFGSYLTPVIAGDTAWVFTPGDSLDRWLPFAVVAVGSVAPGECASGAVKLTAEAKADTRVSLRLAAAPSLGSTIGAPIRVTRPVRYSLYRGGDGRWYLGQRDWNATTLQFNTIQPVSGPFLSAASHGMVFQYSDSAGQPLVAPVADTRAIALVAVDLRGQSRNAMRAFVNGAQGRSADSVHLAIALRNRR
jgi:prepilin-type N-terminal cleavage/methylation domain-containing protein